MITMMMMTRCIQLAGVRSWHLTMMTTTRAFPVCTCRRSQRAVLLVLLPLVLALCPLVVLISVLLVGLLLLRTLFSAPMAVGCSQLEKGGGPWFGRDRPRSLRDQSSTFRQLPLSKTGPYRSNLVAARCGVASSRRKRFESARQISLARRLGAPGGRDLARVAALSARTCACVACR